MAEWSRIVAIPLSLIFGGILSFIFDGIFIAIVIGFLSVYLVKKENRTAFLGGLTAVIYSILDFLMKFTILSAQPPLPSYLQGVITLDFYNLLLGLLLVCLFSFLLGSLGGLLASSSSKELNKKEENKGQYKEIR